ncbi:MAG: choice-of-anchor U domain-containing protein, partial [Methylococcaceae bacterium]
ARNPTKTVISFALKDGGPFDADGLANGSITDPIIPAIVPTPGPAPIPTLSEWAQLLMMMMMLLLLLLMLGSVQFYGRKMMK